MSIAKVMVCLSAAAVISLAAGCGDGPALAEAGGVVKYKGQLVSGATVTLVYDDNRMSSGVTDAEGRFTLTTGGRKGAPIGTAKVSVTKIKSPGEGGMPADPTPDDMIKMYQNVKNQKDVEKMMPKNELPTKYADPSSSGLTADVQSGDNDFLYELAD